MRLRSVSIVLALAWVLPACVSTGRCPPPELLTPASIGTSIALSCVEAFEFDGVGYLPWCAGVKTGLLGDVIARGDDESQRYVMRSIDGVEPGWAVAMKVERLNARATQRESEENCGVWRFAPGTAFGDEATSLARDVVQARFVDELE